MEKQLDSSKKELNINAYRKYYNKNPADSYAIYKKTQIVLKLLKKLKINLENTNILDIGFGTGLTLLKLSKNKSNLFGIEFVKEACYNLNFKKRNYGNQSNLFLASIIKIPFKDNTFDVIICSHVLEHVEEDHLAIKEIWRILRKNGALILLTPNKHHGNGSGLHYRTYSYDDLKRILRNRFLIKYKIKYRTFIDNFLYKISSKITGIYQILDKFSFLDLIFASKYKNLEDGYILIKSGHE